MSIIRIGFILVLFLATRASAGVVLEIESQDHRLQESATVLAIVDGKNLKMTITSDGDQENSEMIYRGESRAMVEQMMKGRMPAPAKAPARPIVKFRNTGERDTKNGYPSVKYEATIEGRKTQEIWVTDWDNVEGGDDADDNPFEHMQELDGFPVLTYDYASDGSIASESSLRSSTQRAVAATEFEPPAAYKQREMMPR